jgi:hypothetical protein
MVFHVQKIQLLLVGLLLSGCLKPNPEVSSEINLCEMNFATFPSCSIFPSASACLAVYANEGECTEVALEDPGNNRSAVCSAHPLSPNGCVGPLFVKSSITQDPVIWSKDCTSPPSLSVLNPSKLNFGDTLIGTPDFSRTITIKNNGTDACPAVLGELAIENTSGGSSPDFFILPSDSCGNGTPLFSGASCSITVIMKSASIGTKSAKLQIPFTFGGSAQAPASVDLSSKVEADQSTFTPSGPELSWYFSPIADQSSLDYPTRCARSDPAKKEFFKGIKITPALPLKVFVSLSMIWPPESISGAGFKQDDQCGDEDLTWADTCFSTLRPDFSDQAQIISPTDFYFKNTSGAIQSFSRPSTARARLSYRLNSSASDAPFKVREFSLKTFCF